MSNNTWDVARLRMSALASELGPHHIRVNSVVPGWMWGPSVRGLFEMLAAGAGLQHQRGRISVDSQGATNTPGVFAGGDCVNGGREVVDAVADGKRAAHGITAHITQQAQQEVSIG